MTTDHHIAIYEIQGPKERRKIASRNLVKYMCIIAGIEPVDSMDGSPNWWMFNTDAEAVYDRIVTRFPPAPEPPGGE